MTNAIATPNPANDPMDPKSGGGRRPLSKEDIVKILQAYVSEAEQNRKSGFNPRDEIWEQNWHQYWSRHDWSEKADWQSTLELPEASHFVERWAAAMAEALTQAGDFFEISIPGDENNDLSPVIKKFIKYLLGRCGRTPDNHEMSFSGLFQQFMVLGAINAINAAVIVKQGEEGKYVAVEMLDPRNTWLDHTGRNLYRFRTVELDYHQLLDLAGMKDSSGNSLYDPDEITALASFIDEQNNTAKQDSTGNSQEQMTSGRKPVKLTEFLCTIIHPDDGKPYVTNSLCVIANDRFLIRGPEKNPWWHKRDWTVYAAMIDVPLSIYGKTYMETWSQISSAFVEMTNLLMDGVSASTLNAFAARPDALDDPAQLSEGVHPNKVFILDDGEDIDNFISEIPLGRLPSEAITIWQGLKAELRDGAIQSEISLGQVPPKGDITATEISEVSRQGSAIVKSMARSVESRFLEPLLFLVWFTGLQHYAFDEPEIVELLGKENAQMIKTRKDDFRKRKFSLRANGISKIIERTQKLRQLLALLNTVAGNEVLLREFLQTYSVKKVLDELITLYGLDPQDIEIDERERIVRGLTDRGNQGDDPSQGSPPAPNVAALAGV